MSCFLTNTSLMCMQDCLLLLQLLFLPFQPFVEVAVLITLQNVFGVLELLFEFKNLLLPRCVLCLFFLVTSPACF